MAIPFLDAGPAGRPIAKALPLHWGYAETLPEGIEALAFAAYLQGRERGSGGWLLDPGTTVDVDQPGSC